jgi:hypothetical protein
MRRLARREVLCAALGQRAASADCLLAPQVSKQIVAAHKNEHLVVSTTPGSSPRRRFFGLDGASVL